MTIQENLVFLLQKNTDDTFGIHKIKLLGQQKGLKFDAKT